MRDADAGAAAANGAAAKKDRSSVSWGPELTMPSRDAQAERDALLLRGVMRNEALATYEKRLTPGAAATLATEDVAAIGDIKDQAMRKQAMLSARNSRQASPDYKLEFTSLAPALALKVDTMRPASNAQSPALTLRSPPAPANMVEPSARLKADAFLYTHPAVAIRKYPDLVTAYELVHAANSFAERNFPGHAQKFVDIAIDAVVGQIERGEPILESGLTNLVKQNGDRRNVELPRGTGPQLVR